MSDEGEDTTIYMAISTDFDQYSIWPVGRALPMGWHEVGKQGPRAEVLAWIEEVWTDMRPKSVREKMGE